MNYIIMLDQSGQPYLAHHGILGQKWGVRRYQNEDGTLTEAGKKRLRKYSKKADKADKKIEKYEKKAEKEFEKGQKRYSSFLYSDEAAQKNLQKSNRYKAKSSVMRARMNKKFNKTVRNMDISKLDPDFVARGKAYLENNSALRNQIYTTTLSDLSRGNKRVMRYSETV